MNDMWEALKRYQPFADKRGFGDAWLKMTTERTADAARAASWAASWAARVAPEAARAATWAVNAAWESKSNADAARAADAAMAIRYIDEAIELESKS